MRKRITLIFIVLSFIWGCANNQWKIDISQVEIQQEYKRFEQDLFNLPLDSIWEYVPELQEEYGRFFPFYNKAVINIGGTNQLDYDEKLAYFLTDPDIRGTYEIVQEVFPELGFKGELTSAFKRYHFYYPQKTIPDIYTHISGFNQSIIVDTSYVSISLDKYLGQNNKYYQMLRTPVYKRNNMVPAKIPSDVMYAWAVTEFPYQPVNDNLISQMIYYGKIHLFLEAMLPESEKELLWGFSEEKLKWCEKNEKQMWLYLVENKLLFESGYKVIKRYIDDGPFTSTFSKQSPAKTGRWLGHQILKSYLKHNDDITLPELMRMQDYQKILNESKYRP